MPFIYSILTLIFAFQRNGGENQPMNTAPSSHPASPTIRPRERDALLQSLRAGVVPRSGQQHIQVGRVEEVKALLRDIERVADGGSAFRMVIGEYGSGKTFFLNLIRSIALEKNSSRRTQTSLQIAAFRLRMDRRAHSTLS